HALRISPRMEDFAVDTETQETLPLIGLDLIAEGSRYAAQSEAEKRSIQESIREMEDPGSIWVSEGLGKKPGEHLKLLVNDQVMD
ncbi:hypothetical protein, partial [Pseudomonas sp. DP16D-R1]|uniref:hypothetical protein n=1 Tax=Pseudomonas sp. DP16D-R1 TaxID=2075551 RepID=UPI000CD39B48